MKITRIDSELFRVDTGDIAADCRPIADVCVLDGSHLRTHYDGSLHTVPPIRVKLGLVSLARIQSLAVNESAQF